MKRTLCLAFSLLCMVLLFSEGISADVLYEPKGNTFYRQHRQELERVEHRYRTNGPEGRTTAYANPLTGEGRTELENGLITSSSLRYTDKNGNTWLCCTLWQGNAPEDYWIPEAYLYRLYDHELFLAEHKAEITEKNGERRMFGEVLTLYFTPNGEVKGTITVPESGGYTGETVFWTLEYTDENGTVWGYIGYYYGYRDNWIKLSTASVETKAASASSTEPEIYTGPPVSPAEDRRLPLLLVTLLLAAGAAAAVFLLKKRSRRE